jgi:hypothetical protein
MTLDELNQIAAQRRTDFLRAAEAIAPGIPTDQMASLISPDIICPWNLSLPPHTLSAVKECIKTAFELRSHSGYQSFLQEEFRTRNLHPIENCALFMSYDFHLKSDMLPALIEINTNASFQGLSYALSKSRSLSHELGPEPETFLKQDILQEVAPYHGPEENLRIEICDEAPESQKLYSEFLFFKFLFQKWGWKADIVDVANVSSLAHLIYNRHTDFYLSTPATAQLRKIYESNRSAISPNPNEYLFLADKQRMIDWSVEENFQAWGCAELGSRMQKFLLPSRNLASAHADELWFNRKKYFFKPLRAFGSKQSYRGASISRKLFETLLDQDFIAQEFCSPLEVVLSETEDSQTFKFDLRVYAYKGEYRGCVARLYQGQVTNTRTPLGGFCPVVWSSDATTATTFL